MIKKHMYDVNKNQINRLRDNEEECQSVIKGIASEYDDPDIKREIKVLNDLEEILKNGHRFSLEEKNKFDAEVAAQKEKISVQMENFNELFRIAHDSFQSLCNEKDRIFYEKRIIIRFLRPICENSELLVMQSVENAAAERIYAIDNEVAIVEQFYDQFLQEKDIYQEKAFKLFELANYIHENNFTKDELDIVSYFVKKVKGNYNVSRSQYKSEYLNPNQYISIDIFEKTFKIFKEKREHEIEIIDKIVEHFNDTLDKKMPRDTQERVRQKIEYNMMYDIFQKVFDDYEEQIDILYAKIQNVINFVLNDKSKMPNQFKNMIGYLIWGIYDQQDQYLPIEIRQKIEKNPPNSKTQVVKKLFGLGRLAEQDDKEEAIGDILGFNSGKNRSQDSEIDFENNKFLKFGDQKFEQNASEVQSDEEVLSPFQNKKKRNVRRSVEEDEDFAIEILNNKNNKINRPGKLPFLNENDISGISLENQISSQKFKR